MTSARHLVGGWGRRLNASAVINAREATTAAVRPRVEAAEVEAFVAAVARSRPRREAAG